MRKVLLTLLLTAIPSYAACFDGEAYTTDCREAAQAYRDRGFRVPRSVRHEARLERFQEESRNTRIEALEELRDGVDMDLDLSPRLTDDDDIKAAKKRLRQKLEIAIQSKIYQIEAE